MISLGAVILVACGCQSGHRSAMREPCGERHALVTQSASTPNDAKPQVLVASVFNDRFAISVPIENIDKTWVWGVSDRNVCEYSWQLNIISGKETFQLGFTYFNPNAIKQSGSFADLLRAGQNDIWKIDASGGTNVGSLNATTDGTHLNFSITDKVWIGRLFSDRPKTIIFETGGVQLKPDRQEVTVKYVKSAVVPSVVPRDDESKDKWIKE